MSLINENEITPQEAYAKAAHAGAGVNRDSLTNYWAAKGISGFHSFYGDMHERAMAAYAAPNPEDRGWFSGLVGSYYKAFDPYYEMTGQEPLHGGLKRAMEKYPELAEMMTPEQIQHQLGFKSEIPMPRAEALFTALRKGMQSDLHRIRQVADTGVISEGFGLLIEMATAATPVDFMATPLTASMKGIGALQKALRVGADSALTSAIPEAALYGLKSDVNQKEAAMEGAMAVGLGAAFGFGVRLTLDGAGHFISKNLAPEELAPVVHDATVTHSPEVAEAKIVLDKIKNEDANTEAFSKSSRIADTPRVGTIGERMAAEPDKTVGQHIIDMLRPVDKQDLFDRPETSAWFADFFERVGKINPEFIKDFAIEFRPHKDMGERLGRDVKNGNRSAFVEYDEATGSWTRLVLSSDGNWTRNHLANYLVHESGHLAESLIKKDAEIQTLWDNLPVEEKQKVRDWYADPNIDDLTLRGEWFAHIFHRVVANEYDDLVKSGVDKTLVDKIKAMWENFRDTLLSYINTDRADIITHKELEDIVRKAMSFDEQNVRKIRGSDIGFLDKPKATYLQHVAAERSAVGDDIPQLVARLKALGYEMDSVAEVALRNEILPDLDSGRIPTNELAYPARDRDGALKRQGEALQKAETKLNVAKAINVAKENVEKARVFDQKVKEVLSKVGLSRRDVPQGTVAAAPPELPLRGTAEKIYKAIVETMGREDITVTQVLQTLMKQNHFNMESLRVARQQLLREHAAVSKIITDMPVGTKLEGLEKKRMEAAIEKRDGIEAVGAELRKALDSLPDEYYWIDPNLRNKKPDHIPPSAETTKLSNRFIGYVNKLINDGADIHTLAHLMVKHIFVKNSNGKYLFTFEELEAGYEAALRQLTNDVVFLYHKAQRLGEPLKSTKEAAKAYTDAEIAAVKELKAIVDVLRDATDQARGINHEDRKLRLQGQVLGSPAERRHPKDVDYMAAVERGDMEAVKRMVDEAAKAAGYDSNTQYHGTDSMDFTEFDTDKIGSKTDPGFFGRGFYFSPEKDIASRWGKRVIDARIKLRNPLRVSGITEFIEKSGQKQVNQNLPESQKKKAFERAVLIATNNLKRLGYDGVIRTDSQGREWYVAFNPSQIKSADPITRDASGNVIPLSKRFNETSDDIMAAPAEGRDVKHKTPSGKEMTAMEIQLRIKELTGHHNYVYMSTDEREAAAKEAFELEYFVEFGYKEKRNISNYKNYAFKFASSTKDRVQIEANIKYMLDNELLDKTGLTRYIADQEAYSGRRTKASSEALAKAKKQLAEMVGKDKVEATVNKEIVSIESDKAETQRLNNLKVTGVSADEAMGSGYQITSYSDFIKGLYKYGAQDRHNIEMTLIREGRISDEAVDVGVKSKTANLEKFRDGLNAKYIELELRALKQLQAERRASQTIVETDATAKRFEGETKGSIKKVTEAVFRGYDGKGHIIRQNIEHILNNELFSVDALKVFIEHESNQPRPRYDQIQQAQNQLDARLEAGETFTTPEVAKTTPEVAKQPQVVNIDEAINAHRDMGASAEAAPKFTPFEDSYAREVIVARDMIKRNEEYVKQALAMDDLNDARAFIESVGVNKDGKPVPEMVRQMLEAYNSARRNTDPQRDVVTEYFDDIYAQRAKEIYFTMSAKKKWLTMLAERGVKYVRAKLDGGFLKGMSDGVGDNIETRVGNARSQANGYLLEPFSKDYKYEQDFLNGRYNDQLDKALRGETEGIDPRLVEFAKRYKELSDSFVDKARGYGSLIRHRKDFIMQTVHDNVMNHSFRDWYNDVSQWVDIQKMREHGIIEGDEMSYFKDVYEYLTSPDGNLNHRMNDFNPQTMGGNINRRVAHGRSILLMPDKVLAYDSKYGSGNMARAINDQVAKRAEMLEVMEHFGPDYKQVQGEISNQIQDTYDRKLWNWTVQQIAGENNHPVNLSLARWRQTVDGLARLFTMHGSGITSATMDPATALGELRYLGLKGLSQNYVKSYGNFLVNGMNSNPQMRDRLRGLGMGFDSLHNALMHKGVLIHEQGTGAHGIHGWVDNMNKHLFQKNGLIRATEAGQMAVLDILEQSFGEMIRLGDFKGSQTAHAMKRYGLSPADFKDLPVASDGRLMLTSIADTELRDRVSVMFSDIIRRAILQPKASDKALLTFGTKAGTVMGEAIRTSTMFLPFALATYSKIHARTFMGFKGEGAWKNELLWFSLQSFTLAVAATTIKDVLLQGREPQFFDDDFYMNRWIGQSGLIPVVDSWIMGEARLPIGPAPMSAWKIATALGDEDRSVMGEARKVLPFSGVQTDTQNKIFNSVGLEAFGVPLRISERSLFWD